MSDPVCTQKKPYVVELEPNNEYWYCTCGRSADQPWCDGSHQGTGFTPKSFTVDEKKKYGLCGCRHSSNQPFCDATHRTLAD
jgi:CDGSH-type Zn-finger protein